MSKKTVDIPYKQYPSTLDLYSEANQTQSKQYKNIIESETEQAYHDRAFPTIGDAALGPLNANVPVYRNAKTVFVDNKPINVYEQFWQFRQSAGQTFTDHRSAGVSNVLEDLAVRDLPLQGMTESTPDLVLSNTNNVRNNMQNYGKSFLLTTNLLNAQAFKNGVYNGQHASSPYRPGDTNEMNEIEHSNFQGTNGDLYSRMKGALRVDLPSNYAQTSLYSWQKINPICVVPNSNANLPFNLKLKYGTFNLDSMKFIGESCFTPDFNVIPEGYDTPQNVFADDMNYPPLSNINYYNKGDLYKKKDGPSNNLYCSKNTHFAAMPTNYKYPHLDTSFTVSPGNNSVALGTQLSVATKQFINNNLYNFNKNQILKALISQFSTSSDFEQLSKKYPEIKSKDFHSSYNNLGENNKYTTVYNKQQWFHANHPHSPNPGVSAFILEMDIFKLGGSSDNTTKMNGKVMLDLVEYEIKEPGVFLLLPSMLNEDLFNLKADTVGKCVGSNPEQTAQNCCFRGPSDVALPSTDDWTTNTNYTPLIMSDVSNLRNPGCGPNPYNAPTTF